MRLSLIALLGVLGTGVWAQQPQQAPPPSAAPQNPSRGRGPMAPPPAFSRIKVYDFATRSVRDVFSSDGYFESPDFSADGKFIRFISSSDTRLLQVPVTGGTPEPVGPAGFGWGHDRARSRDGNREVAGNFNAPNPIAFLGPHYTDPRPVGGPFYVHTMSPDGEWMAGSCGGRVCRMAWPGGGAFQMLTSGGGNDNADYGPDGKFLYFESSRSGKREIWRVPADGAGPDDSLAERVSDEEGASRFPHPSPDGKWIAFMVAKPGSDPRDVTIRLIPAPGAKAAPGPSREILAAAGGQGMMHRNSWSPDSTKIAFASYEPR
jgi:TolB protein